MIDEKALKERLVDMFAAFPTDCRKGILEQLKLAIDSTEEDVTGGSVSPSDIIIQQSMQNLMLMQECCQQAQTEFEELSKK